MRISIPNLHLAVIQDLKSPTWILKCKLGYRGDTASMSPGIYVVLIAVEIVATDLVYVASRSFLYNMVCSAKIEGWFPDSVGCKMKDLVLKWKYDFMF